MTLQRSRRVFLYPLLDPTESTNHVSEREWRRNKAAVIVTDGQQVSHFTFEQRRLNPSILSDYSHASRTA